MAKRRHRATAELLAQSPRWEREERRGREGPRRSPAPCIDPANVPHLGRSQCTAAAAIEEQHAAPRKARAFPPGMFDSFLSKETSDASDLVQIEADL